MEDLDNLLAPISDAAPSGDDLSFSAEFDTIAEARRADDPSLDQGEWVTTLKAADWPAVIREGQTLLRERSKDLRLGAWLAEAYTRSQGFAGLAAGYRLVARLCEQFWDTLHPQEDSDEHEQRAGVLSWLLVQSERWMRELPLIDAPQGRYSTNDFDRAHSQNLRARENEEGGGAALADLEAARRATPFEVYAGLAQTAPDCQAALAELERVVDARLGQDGPSFTATRDQLATVVGLALRFAREAGVHLEGPRPEEIVSPDVQPAAAAAPARGGEITTRKEALAQLRRVAEYFRRTEPHSPVAYLADKAARWGEMPLHVWLKSVIKDDASLSHVEDLLDVDRSPREPSDP